MTNENEEKPPMELVWGPELRIEGNTMWIGDSGPMDCTGISLWTYTREGQQLTFVAR